MEGAAPFRMSGTVLGLRYTSGLEPYLEDMGLGEMLGISQSRGKRAGLAGKGLCSSVEEQDMKPFKWSEL